MKLRKLIAAALSLTVMCGAAASTAASTAFAASTSAEVPVSAVITQAGEGDYIGKWDVIYAEKEGFAFDLDGLVFYMDLRSGGTGTIYSSADGQSQTDSATWSSNGNTLTVVDIFEGGSDTYNMYFSNNMLSLTGDNGLTMYLAKHKPGDPNSDGNVDAKDASFILAEYVKISTGKTSSLTDLQRAAADVRADGIIDAKDASVILAYYSYTSTGGTDSLPVCLANA